MLNWALKIQTHEFYKMFFKSKYHEPIISIESCSSTRLPAKQTSLVFAITNRASSAEATGERLRGHFCDLIAFPLAYMQIFFYISQL